MSEKKIVVPEGMLKAFDEACVEYRCGDRNAAVPNSAHAGLEAALRWLSENLPNRSMTTGTDAEREIYNTGYEHALYDVRRMFLAPQTDVTGDIADLLYSSDNELDIAVINEGMHASNDRVIEAYRRGKESNGTQ